jgi:hypothetical protein
LRGKRAFLTRATVNRTRAIKHAGIAPYSISTMVGDTEKDSRGMVLVEIEAKWRATLSAKQPGSLSTKESSLQCGDDLGAGRGVEQDAS